MGRQCTTCQHPERERIDTELALSSNVAEVAARYGIARRSMSRHRQNCMTQKQIAQIRGITPAQAEVEIEELARRGGEDSIIGFSRLVQECKESAEKCEKLGLHSEVATFRKLQLAAYKEKAKIAAIYPGRKTVTNNNLVVADGAEIFQLVNQVLSRAESVPHARQLLAAEYVRMARPALLEHAA